MLRSLYIQEFILIDKLFIEFRNGLNIITGETGAGKSIILGALSLLQGNRADTESLGIIEKKCIIEAAFEIKSDNLKSYFEENELDFDTHCMLRREISPQGRSRAFINDTPVNLHVLKTVAAQLFDIHSQHQTLLLSEPGFRMNIIDTTARINEQVEQYQIDYRQLLNLKSQINQQELTIEKARAEEDYLKFQLGQLHQLPFKSPGEQQELEQEFEELNHAEEIKRSLETTLDLLDRSEFCILSNLKTIRSELDQAGKYSARTKELASRIENVRIELKDIASDAETLSDQIQVSAEQLENIRSKLDLLNTQLIKHRVNSLHELFLLRDEMQKKITSIEALEIEREKLEKEFKTQNTAIVQHALLISAHRKEIIPKINEFVTGYLRQLGIKHAIFEVELIENSQLTEFGYDHINFLFTANQQHQAKDLSKTASGGELSRIMLCLKSLSAGSGNYPTLIFDEIDTGVSGEIAHKVGSIVKEISKETQVLNITHLPQVAAHGDYHFLVYKDEEKNTTGIKELDQANRLQEIAKMISGKSIDNTALDHAAKLLKESQEKPTIIKF